MLSLNQVLITTREMAEPALLALGVLISDLKAQRRSIQTAAMVEARLQLQGVSEAMLTFTQVVLALRALNEAEVDLLWQYAYFRLQGIELPDGTETSYYSGGRIFSGEVMLPLPTTKLPLPNVDSRVVLLGADDAQDREQVLAMFDQAIERKVSSGQPAFEARMWREWYRLGPGPAWDALIPYCQEALAYHKQHDDRLQQVSTLKILASLAARTGNTPAALAHLAEAEHLLTDLPPDEITRLTQHMGLSREAFTHLLLRRERDDIQQARMGYLGCD